MKNKLVIISIDALVYEDLAVLSKKPVFNKILEEGSRVNTLRTIYPSLTYPVHKSIITGMYPEKHGVINNEVFQVGKLKNDWNWFHDVSRVNDIFDYAKAAGKTTAAVFWPVTGNHPSIDYLIDEYWPQSQDDDPKSVFLRSGSSEEIYEKIIKKYVNGITIPKHPEVDSFIINCACDVIREYKPDVLAIHPANIDAYRHATGVFSDMVTEGLNEVEIGISRIIEATKNAGTFENTNFVILSDHGQLNITRVINPNVLLKEAGFIQVDENDAVVDWQAYCHSAALSTQVYLKEPYNKDLHNNVYNLLCRLRDEQVYGISQVFTAEEIEEKEHLKGEFSFVLETDGYTSFGNAWNRPLVSSFDITDYKFGRATHGHLPDKGPQPVFIACGPDIKKGVVLQRKNIIDIAPTMAEILEISLPDVDGVAIKEILKL